MTKLPRHFSKYDHEFTRSFRIQHDAYSVTAAKGAHNMYAIRPTVSNEMTPAARLASAITRGNWSARHKAYLASAADTEKFMHMFATGWTADCYGVMRPAQSQ